MINPSFSLFPPPTSFLPHPLSPPLLQRRGGGGVRGAKPLSDSLLKSLSLSLYKREKYFYFVCTWLPISPPLKKGD